MAKGQHTNVIEPPKRTAHNIAYWSERLLEIGAVLALLSLLHLSRTWSFLAFTLMSCLCLMVATTLPTLVNGRIVDFVARAQETLIESDRGEDQK